MPNYRFTILIRQDVSRYYIVDIIIVDIIHLLGYIPYNEEYPDFCKPNFMEWQRVMHNFFCL